MYIILIIIMNIFCKCLCLMNWINKRNQRISMHIEIIEHKIISMAKSEAWK